MTLGEAGVIANREVTSIRLGLRRMKQAGKDSYEPSTVAPRASVRFIDGLDALDPDVKDAHDIALADAEAAAREDRDDTATLE